MAKRTKSYRVYFSKDETLPLGNTQMDFKGGKTYPVVPSVYEALMAAGKGEDRTKPDPEKAEK